jgi:hypothetical protein
VFISAGFSFIFYWAGNHLTFSRIFILPSRYTGLLPTLPYHPYPLTKMLPLFIRVGRLGGVIGRYKSVISII